jgi:kynurenine formamidase
LTDRRVQFDFKISFANGGGIQGQKFRLDIDTDSINDRELAELLVADLRLLMVESVEVKNQTYVDEQHKRISTPTSRVIVVDLSHPIRDGMITYPGLPGPVITDHLSREASREHYAEGVRFQIGKIEMVANTGTYVDAPSHRYGDGIDIANLPLDRLVDVPAVVVECREKTIGGAEFSDVDIRGKAVLLHTGWDSHFETETYLGGHPYLTEEGARLMVEGGALLVGIDSANIDDTEDRARPAHSLLLGAGIPVVEHLTNLDKIVGNDLVELIILPAPVVGMGTFPVRAVARIRTV